MSRKGVGFSIPTFMKIPRFLSLAAAAFALVLSARADDADLAKRRMAAEEFLSVRRTEDLVNATATQMGEMTDRISDGASRQAGAGTNPAELAAKLRTEARGMIARELTWDSVRPAFVQAYADAFTEAELHEMTAFYKSPAGQKLVATDPQVLGQMEKSSREKAMALMPRVVQRLREMVAATNPPGSSPPSLAPPLPPGLTVPPAPPANMLPPAVPPAAPRPPLAPPPAAAPTPTR